MIVFDLSCDDGHRFEGWFGSSGAFAEQQAAGQVVCPVCGSDEVAKAPMAPAVPAKANSAARPSSDAGDPSAAPTSPATPMTSGALPAKVEKAMKALAEAQAAALKDSTWVGDKFAEQSRSMHYGEADEKPIHGKASVKEAKELLDEGIAVSPLPFPVAEPDELN